MKAITLNNGAAMPVVGLGTWRAQPEEVIAAVTDALDVGYRHIDTAFNYNTEEPIGDAVQKWIEAGNGKREDLFLTTKLPNVGNRAKDVGRFLTMSLEKLKTSYVDLYLIHMPFSFFPNEITWAPLLNEDGSIQLDTQSDLIDTWLALENEVKAGRTRAIGLSNFNLEQVQRIHAVAEIKPSVLQIELHAYHQQKDVVAKCKELDIAVTAYAPLGSPGANQHFIAKYDYEIEDYPDVLGHPVVLEMAVKYQKTPGQILLRHLVQQDIIVIPKSQNKQRIAANFDVMGFELREDDMERLNALDRGEAGKIFDFLFFKGVEKHPEYPFKDRLTK